MQRVKMTWGDYTSAAPFYAMRPPHSPDVVKAIRHLVGLQHSAVEIAELGAGTGNLLRSLAGLGISGFAVEPNAAMREQAAKLLQGLDIAESVQWRAGTAEVSGLPDACVNWILLGNVLQFVDRRATLRECRRLLKPGGFLTIIWNTRNHQQDHIMNKIEDIPVNKRPGLKKTMISIDELMESIVFGDQFREYIYMHRSQTHIFTRERFLAIWKGDNEIASQVDSDMWEEILREQDRHTPDVPNITTVWRTRAWTYTAL